MKRLLLLPVLLLSSCQNPNWRADLQRAAIAVNQSQIQNSQQQQAEHQYRMQQAHQQAFGTPQSNYDRQVLNSLRTIERNTAPTRGIHYTPPQGY